MFRELTDEEVKQLLAFLLQNFMSNKNSVIDAIQSLSTQFVENFRLFKQKLNSGESIEISNYYIGSLTKKYAVDRIKNFERRTRCLTNQFDCEDVSRRFNGFAELITTFVQEVIDRDGLKFLKDLINQLYVAIKSPKLDSEDSDSSSEESVDQQNKTLTGTSLVEKQLLEITDVQNKATISSYVKKYFEEENVILFISGYFAAAIEIGRQRLDFRNFELQVNQAADAVYKINLDLKKSKSDRDNAFVSYFEKVHKDLALTQT